MPARALLLTLVSIHIAIGKMSLKTKMPARALLRLRTVWRAWPCSRLKTKMPARALLPTPSTTTFVPMISISLKTKMPARALLPPVKPDAKR